MEVRRAVLGDLELLLRLQESFCAELRIGFDSSARRSGLAALLDNQELGGAWLASVEAGAVGYVVLGYGFSLEFGGRDAFVDELFVAPEQRGRGVARALLERALGDGAAVGVQAFHLEVEDASPAARTLYEKFGFRLRGHRLMTRPA